MTFFFQLKPAASVHLLEIWLCLESQGTWVYMPHGGLTSAVTVVQRGA